MSLADNVIPVWTILMPYDKWEAGEITDQELWEWLNNPDNHVPPEAIENWRPVLTDDKDTNAE